MLMTPTRMKAQSTLWSTIPSTVSAHLGVFQSRARPTMIADSSPVAMFLQRSMPVGKTACLLERKDRNIKVVRTRLEMFRQWRWSSIREPNC